MDEQHGDHRRLNREIEEARALLQEHGGVPGFEDEMIGDGMVKARSKRFISVTMVRLLPKDEEPDTVGDPDQLGAGLRFEVSDESHRPLYSFAVDYRLIFGAMGAAYPQRGGGDSPLRSQ
jgi:hypothetical protein